jgi:hypothetical protein
MEESFFICEFHGNPHCSFFEPFQNRKQPLIFVLILPYGFGFFVFLAKKLKSFFEGKKVSVNSKNYLGGERNRSLILQGGLLPSSIKWRFLSLLIDLFLLLLLSFFLGSQLWKDIGRNIKDSKASVISME